MMLIDLSTFDVTKNGGQSILDSDLTMNTTKVFHYFEVLIETDTSVIFEYTRNGTNWFELNDNSVLNANNGYTFDIPAKISDTFNIRPKTGTSVGIKGLIRGLRLD